MEWITTCNNEVFIVQISKQLLSYVIWFNMLHVGCWCVRSAQQRERGLVWSNTRRFTMKRSLSSLTNTERGELDLRNDDVFTGFGVSSSGTQEPEPASSGKREPAGDDAQQLQDSHDSSDDDDDSDRTPCLPKKHAKVFRAAMRGIVKNFPRGRQRSQQIRMLIRESWELEADIRAGRFETTRLPFGTWDLKDKERGGLKRSGMLAAEIQRAEIEAACAARSDNLEQAQIQAACVASSKEEPDPEIPGSDSSGELVWCKSVDNLEQAQIQAACIASSKDGKQETKQGNSGHRAETRVPFAAVE